MILTKDCSAIIHNNLSKKMPDPINFQISCTTRSTTFEKALCDIGTGINLMPLSVMKKLIIQEAQPTRIALQMADKSLKQAHGIIENVLVKITELFLPTDFVILDMGKDAKNFMILGRPFLATGRAQIDVDKGELVMRMHEDYLVFNVFKPSSLSGEGGTYM
ncbi:uncharacterized protein LOC127746664 [Arachis duranensis]|uniref:Uncharacterized protein LOC127746664 n=1 Tax=Arachis duranensis TaxID=130453 RepID=A0A9C6TW91_ARADU|nr:uncharacterized protein LOC127746664 [Arachis duranensis]